MKKAIAIVTLLSIVACVQAGPDIQFSPVLESPSQWFYDGSGTFSFSQSIGVHLVQGSTTDALYQQLVYIPDLVLSNYAFIPAYNLGIGDISAGNGLVEIKNAGGTVLLAGILSDGMFSAQGATGSFFNTLTLDILVTEVNAEGSDLLSAVSVGDYFDFNLTIQGNVDLNVMIQQNMESGNGFSGSMSWVIPEPATLSILGLGALALLRRRK